MTTRVQAILTAAVSAVTGLGAAVFEGREDPIGTAECPAINVRPGALERTPLGRGMDQWDFDLELELHVRGQSWTDAAEALKALVVSAIAASAPLAAIGSGPRLQGSIPDADPAEENPGRLTATWRFTWAAPPGAA